MTRKSALAASSVLLVGAGGLGSPAALALAASGVGRMGLVDDDVVDLSNLARQILHRTVDLGRPKVESATERLKALQPGMRVDAHRCRMDAENTSALIAEYDVVLDGSDNLATKLLLNDACVLSRRPLVTGGVLRFFGQAMTVIPGKTACYRCVFGGFPGGDEGPSCAQAGVMGAAVGVIGMAQAGEVVRLLSGLAPAWADRLLLADLWSGRFHQIALARDPDCPLCGIHPAIRSLERKHYAQFAEREAGGEITAQGRA